MSFASPDSDTNWDENVLIGSFKFVKKLQKYFEELNSLTTEGAELARKYALRSKEIGLKLVEDNVANNEEDVNTVGAIHQGNLDAARLENYLKLHKELRHLAAREDDNIRLEEKAKWKMISRWAKELRKRV